MFCKLFYNLITASQIDFLTGYGIDGKLSALQSFDQSMAN